MVIDCDTISLDLIERVVPCLRTWNWDVLLVNNENIEYNCSIYDYVSIYTVNSDLEDCQKFMIITLFAETMAKYDYESGCIVSDRIMFNGAINNLRVKGYNVSRSSSKDFVNGFGKSLKIKKDFSLNGFSFSKKRIRSNIRRIDEWNKIRAQIKGMMKRDKIYCSAEYYKEFCLGRLLSLLNNYDKFYDESEIRYILYKKTTEENGDVCLKFLIDVGVLKKDRLDFSAAVIENIRKYDWESVNSRGGEFL